MSMEGLVLPKPKYIYKLLVFTFTPPANLLLEFPFFFARLNMHLLLPICFLFLLFGQDFYFPDDSLTIPFNHANIFLTLGTILSKVSKSE